MVAATVVLVAVTALATPSPAGPTDAYPDPPLPAPGGPEAGTEAGGVNEDANWVPFLGNHELWCTMRNPGWSGCSNHHGYPAIDIGMPVGTPIYASGPGRIVEAGSAGDARGVYVVIEHDDGVESRYYHLSRSSVSRGQRVERGTRIGSSGNTGRTTSPHLHYEERTASGAQKDPGVMYGVVGGRLVTYPNVSGNTSWWRTPYGTRIRNQGFTADNTTLYWGGPGVATGDLNGDGFDDTVTGAPGEDVGPALDAGEVDVVYGSALGPVATGSEALVQGRDGVKGTAAGNEVFGAAVAVGDFDGDGFDDVAAGAPAATVNGARAAGEVIVVHGSVEGALPATRSLRLFSDAPDVPGVSESGDQFGAALAAGDFDGDGIDDLAVGVPGEGLPRAPAAGAVTVFYGSATGLVRLGGIELRADTALAGEAEAGDRFGVALAAGDVNGDGVDDLAVGVPGEDTGTGSAAAGDAGAVVVVRGRPATGSNPGLRATGSVELFLDSPGVAGDGRPGDLLGTSLAMGDLDGDRYADIVAGVVGKDVGSATDAGSVLVLRGSARGVVAARSRHLHADSPNVPGAAEAGDRLGSGVALGDVNGDGAPEVIVGIGGEDVTVRGGGVTDAGAALVLRGVLPVPVEGIGSSGGRERHAGTATSGLIDSAEAGDVLGGAVAVGDLNGDDVLDVVIGVPGEDLTGARDAGAVVAVFGVPGETLTGPSVVLHGDLPGMVGDAERGDRWGGLFPIYLR